jgi:hypothetical protein
VESGRKGARELEKRRVSTFDPVVGPTIGGELAGDVPLRWNIAERAHLLIEALLLTAV